MATYVIYISNIRHGLFVYACLEGFNVAQIIGEVKSNTDCCHSYSRTSPLHSGGQPIIKGSFARNQLYCPIYTMFLETTLMCPHDCPF